MTRRLLALAVFVSLAAPSSIAAHSLLLESSPAADTTIDAPDRVVLRFNNRVEPTLCRVRLIDERGARHVLRLEGASPSPDRLVALVREPVANAPALGAGQYRVEWQVLSVDGHVVTGRFAFRVKR